MWDVDAFYRGPLSLFARWSGVILLRLYGAGQGAVAYGLVAMSAAGGRLAARFDRPYRQRQSAWPLFLILAGVTLAVVLVRSS